MIYGIHPVEEALKSSLFQVEKIGIGSRKPLPPLQKIIALARSKQVPVAFTTREELNRMTGGGFHQNVIGFIRDISYASPEDAFSNWKRNGRKGLFLILDGIQDPQNLGSLIRTAVGCGAHGIFLPKDRAVGITPAVARASAGAIAHIPIVRVVNIANTIDLLRKEEIWIFGASGEAKDPIYSLDFTVDVGIVIGAEGKGIRPLVKKKCDRLFSIPMSGPVSSFNASISGGMILYEAVRQRYQAKLMQNQTGDPETSSG